MGAPLSLTLPDAMDSQRLERRLSLSAQLDSAARLLEGDLNARYVRPETPYSGA